MLPSQFLPPSFQSESESVVSRWFLGTAGGEALHLRLPSEARAWGRHTPSGFPGARWLEASASAAAGAGPALAGPRSAGASGGSRCPLGWAAWAECLAAAFFLSWFFMVVSRLRGGREP